MTEPKGVKAKMSHFLKVLMTGGQEEEPPRDRLADGLAAFERGDAADAVINLVAGLVEQPKHLRARIALARIHVGLRQFRQAEEQALAALEHHPKDPAAYTLLGEVLHAERRYDRAESSYRGAITLGAKFVEAHVRLGILEFETNRLDEALKTLEGAIFLDSRDANARYYIAQICLEYEDFKRALIQSHWAEKIDPSFRPIYLLRADIFEHLEDWRNAAAELTKLDSMNMGDVEIYLRIGLAQLKLDAPELAEMAFDRAVGVDSRCWEARFQLAKLHEDSLRLEQALRGYRLLYGVKTYAEQAKLAIDRIEAQLMLVADGLNANEPRPPLEDLAHVELPPLPGRPGGPAGSRPLPARPAGTAPLGARPNNLPGGTGKPKLSELVGNRPAGKPPEKPQPQIRPTLPPVRPMSQSAPLPGLPSAPPPPEAPPPSARNQVLQAQLVMALFMGMANQAEDPEPTAEDAQAPAEPPES